MKVFISQPMRGKTDEEIQEERARVIKECEELTAREGKNLVVIDSFIKNAPDNASPLWYLGESIKWLSDADTAFFAPGWNENRGCRVEHAACSEYGIRIISD